jgi:acyl-coenzyme A thioesterase PaaI-like protein
MTITGAADVAMWLAIMTERGTSEQSVTTDMKTAFLRSARVLKLGKRTAYGIAECLNENGHLLAHHVITYARVGAKSGRLSLKSPQTSAPPQRAAGAARV